jgi:hypothetical protein
MGNILSVVIGLKAGAAADCDMPITGSFDKMRKFHDLLYKRVARQSAELTEWQGTTGGRKQVLETMIRRGR